MLCGQVLLHHFWITLALWPEILACCHTKLFSMQFASSQDFTTSLGTSRYLLEPTLMSFGNQMGHLLTVRGHNGQHHGRGWLLCLFDWGDIADMIGQKEWFLEFLGWSTIQFFLSSETLGHRGNRTHSLSWHPLWIFVDQFWLFIAHLKAESHSFPLTVCPNFYYEWESFYGHLKWGVFFGSPRCILQILKKAAVCNEKG